MTDSEQVAALSLLMAGRWALKSGGKSNAADPWT